VAVPIGPDDDPDEPTERLRAPALPADDPPEPEDPEDPPVGGRRVAVPVDEEPGGRRRF
jgi:hypothetical protein